jgi:aspartate/methionine/tyrosine aminotransferase
LSFRDQLTSFNTFEKIIEREKKECAASISSYRRAIKPVDYTDYSRYIELDPRPLVSRQTTTTTIRYNTKMFQSYDSIMMRRVSTGEEHQAEEEEETEQQPLLLKNGPPQRQIIQKEQLEESPSLANNNNTNNDTNYYYSHLTSKTAGNNRITTIGLLPLLMVVAVASVLLFLATPGDYPSVESASFMTAMDRTSSASSTTVSSQSSSATLDVLGMAHATTTTMSTSITATTTATTTTATISSTLSERGQSLKPGRDDLAAFALAVASPYHPINNPTGYLVMLVAENKLMYPALAARMEQVLFVKQPPQWVFNYGDMRGQVTLRTQLAHMMERSWIAAPVDPDSLVVQSGAGAILDSLAWILANEGDALLLTSPAYPAFAADFAIHGKMTTYYIPTTAEHMYEPNAADLNAVYDQAVAAGHVPRIFVICQPNNPVGRIYSAEAMTIMMEWALSKPTLHVVSDEIYGNSVFPGEHVTSAAEVMWNKATKKNHDHRHHQKEDKDDKDDNDSPTTTTTTTTTYLGDRVHIVAGLSKDWGMSGFRVGSLFTHNSELLHAMEMLSYYDSVSQWTQYGISQLLDDSVNYDGGGGGWVEWYLDENKRRLEETYHACVKALSRIGVTVFGQTKGALFAWADFSSLLHNGQSEQELWWELFQDARILLTSGQSCHGEKPGMFRVVYPWPEGGVVAMEELGDRLVQWKAARSNNSGEKRVVV